MNFSSAWRRRLYWISWGLLILIGLTAAAALWKWYTSGGGFEALYVAIGLCIAGLWTVNRFLAREPEIPDQTSYPASIPQPASHPEVLSSWRRQMSTLFTLEDIHTLAFDLGINYDNLAGDTLDLKVISLLEHTQDRHLLPQLHNKLQQQRPQVFWPPVPDLSFAPQAARNRTNLLNAIQATWIEGFLHRALHHEVLKLTLSYESQAIPQRPWQMVLQQALHGDELIPPDKSLRDIFEAHGRSLLLLGEPGSGKTITLLQLAEELIALAQNNPNEPLPVVLNLSSWADDKLPLADWLVEEIFVQYGVARDLTYQWITQNQFLYLLDGLDEVAADAREGCIATLNAFKAAHPAEMVVCSRIKDYEALHNRLHMGTAVRLQPLTDKQVDDYLRRPGLGMQVVHDVLQTDPVLRELTYNPLLLNVMILAYQGKTAVELQPLASVDGRRRHLFAAFVTAMFARRPLPPNAPYTQTQARRWLSHLASGMSHHDQSVFYIERLQPALLPTNRLQLYYRLTFALGVGLIFGFLGLIFGGPWIGLLVGLTFGIIGGFSDADKSIKPIEELSWHVPSFSRLIEEIREGLLFGLLGGLFGGLIVGVIIGLSSGPENRLLSSVGGGLLGGFSGFMLGGLMFGLIGTLNACFNVQETRQRLEPNQGIHNSGRNALRLGLLYALVFGLLLTLLGGLSGAIIGKLVGQFTFGLFGGAGLGFVFGVSVGLSWGVWGYGGATVLKHYVLRLLLARQDILPYPLSDKKLVAFLDAMVDRILLRQAGGGYVFLHRLLLEYFAASLVEEKTE